MPDKKSKFIKFKNYQYQLKKSHVIFSDERKILKKNVSDDDNILQRHEVYSIGLFLQNGLDDDRSFHWFGYEDNILKWFITEWLGIADIVQKVSLSKKDKKKFVYIGGSVYCTCFILKTSLLLEKVYDFQKFFFF